MLLYMSVANFSNSSYSPLSIFIQPDFNITSTQLGLIVSANFIGAFAMFFVVGILVDRLGSTTALRISFLMMAAGDAIAFLSTSYLELVLAYLILGSGYSITTPATNSRVMEHYYPAHSTPMGIKQAGVPVGIILATAALPVLALVFSLRYAFLAMFLVSITFFFLTGFRKNDQRVSSIDLKSYLSDLVRSMFKHRLLLAFSIVTAALSWGQQTVLTYYVVYMHSIGYLRYTSEILLIFILLGAIFGRLFWMKVGQRIFGNDRSAPMSIITALAGGIVLVFPMLSFQFYLAALLAFFLGMNVVAWNSMFVTAISEIAPREKIGLFSGISLMYISLGAIIGAPISGFVKDVTGTYYDMWMTLGIGLFVASVLFATVVRRIYKASISDSAS